MAVQRVRRNVGFTLIELLVAIAIVAVLVSVGLASFDYVRRFSRDARRKADIEEIASAIERYYNTYHAYPRSSGWCTQISNPSNNWGPDFQNDLSPEFIPRVPLDPSFEGTYRDYFYHNLDGTRFFLYAELETEDRGDDGLSGCARIGGINNEYDYRYPAF